MDDWKLSLYPVLSIARKYLVYKSKTIDDTWYSFLFISSPSEDWEYNVSDLDLQTGRWRPGSIC